MTSKKSKTLQFSLIRTVNREPRLLLLSCYYLERILKISDTGCFGCCSLVFVVWFPSILCKVLRAVWLKKSTRFCTGKALELMKMRYITDMLFFSLVQLLLFSDLPNSHASKSDMLFIVLQYDWSWWSAWAYHHWQQLTGRSLGGKIQSPSL